MGMVSFSKQSAPAGRWRRERPMQQPIIGFDQDDLGDWRAILACGHRQHVRHNPPWVNRPWVLTEAGRAQFLGVSLDCLGCDEGAQPAGPRDATRGAAGLLSCGRRPPRRGTSVSVALPDLHHCGG